MSGIFPHNTDKCHCPDCDKVRLQVSKIADERIALERAACNRTGDRFGHHALRNRHVEYHSNMPLDSAAASWAERRERETAAKLATLRELCRRVCAHRDLGKQAGQDILVTYGAKHCAELNPAHYDAVIRTYETMLADVTVTDRDAEHDARRARVLSPEPPLYTRHLEQRGKGVYYSTVSYYDHDHNRTFKWKWRRGIGWMKVARSGLVFGDRYRKVIFSSLGYNAWHFGSKIGRPDEVYRDDEHGIVRVGPDIIGHHGRITAVEHTETKTVGNISTTTIDRTEFTPLPDVYGDLHSYRIIDGRYEWLSSRKTVKTEWSNDIENFGVVTTEPVRKWHGRKWYGGSLEDHMRQTMSATPNWAGANTGRWEACSMEITDIDPENLRAAFLGGGAKTGPDAENDPINLGGTMISALKLSLLFWRRAHHPSWAYPTKPGMGAGAVREALQNLCRDKLITFDGGDNYSLTPRAEVLIDAIQNLPLPTQPEPVWVMPKAT